MKMKITKRNIILILFDIACFWTVILAYFFLSEYTSTAVQILDTKTFWVDVSILFGLVFLTRVIVGAYNTVWRYTSTESYFRLVLSDVIGACIAVIIARSISYNLGFWFFIPIAAIHTLFALFSRYSYRLLYKYTNKKKEQIHKKKNICIVGAGQLGVFLANELQNNPNSRYNPICFIDVDKSKLGARIAGLEVRAKTHIEVLVDKYNVEEVIVAISKIDSEKLKEIRDYYMSYGCAVKLYDSPIQDKGKEVSGQKRVIRDFSIEDLLFRDQLSILGSETTSYYKDKIVMVTGGGGSIGSEIARQIAKCQPQRLIIFDIYENNAYEVQQELIRKYGKGLDLAVEIGSVRDVKRLEQMFDTYRPQIVFHAAAHKHVPLMEQSSAEAIKNNVLGTYNTANMAEKYNVERFVLISTDKAVNPTNIMGASKRLCEMVVQCRRDSRTCFSAVRFGNVLGSNGSVIPLFKKQIAAGGPITITDKRIIRYFMTIPEASQLVMTAGAMARKGDLFVLDMGKPVKIYDLAVNMIRMSGFVPHDDIEIKEIGLRPGEKLYEELLMNTEKLDMTSHKLIFIERDKPESRESIEQKIAILRKAIVDYEEHDTKFAIKNAIKALVPTFKEPEEVNKCAEQSHEMKLTNGK